MLEAAYDFFLRDQRKRNAVLMTAFIGAAATTFPMTGPTPTAVVSIVLVSGVYAFFLNAAYQMYSRQHVVHGVRQPGETRPVDIEPEVLPIDAKSTIDKRTAAAAILGELIPRLEYAAPVLLDRLDRGLPLAPKKRPPDDLGDGSTEMIDARLLDLDLELFRVMEPYVTAALSYGMLRILQSRPLHEHGKTSREELLAALVHLRTQNAELRRSLDSIARALSISANVPVTQSEVDEAIAAAIARLAQDER